jgi:hypothetical protein
VHRLSRNYRFTLVASFLHNSALKPNSPHYQVVSFSSKIALFTNAKVIAPDAMPLHFDAAAIRHSPIISYSSMYYWLLIPFYRYHSRLDLGKEATGFC